MSPTNDETMTFEQRAGALLEESVLRVDGHARSRLNQARQAAVAEAVKHARRPAFWRHFTLMPATGAVAAALLVAVMVWHGGAPGESPITEVGGTHTAAEDLDLLADSEALDLVEDGDGSGSFYEWAVDQTSDSSPAAQQGETAS